MEPGSSMKVEKTFARYIVKSKSPVQRKKKFAKAAWLRYNDSGEDYYELLSLKEQNALVNPRQRLGQLVDVEVNANVALDVYELRGEVLPADDDDSNFEGAVGLDEVERVGIKRSFRYL